ncbi:hypothetical protein SODALDRAFT_362499 [Sodiomyces alkalinus F11]|uniref:Uncharacterized protein n=1 Tax=Sodiomyces alkalinus (strain CBS 110278 / VKM F-3762 / F11) TaxID=1314773 RepID=A0A3N2PMD6_SODAK|nr:hypothetical protein SODALDRAFT_362499 [Sodiomyces alkalinus F11]ROT35678.1 hypothetical protein SODALDRAFT_362499 [Sodiomyces alkalinus F11]
MSMPSGTQSWYDVEGKALTVVEGNAQQGREEEERGFVWVSRAEETYGPLSEFMKSQPGALHQRQDRSSKSMPGTATQQLGPGLEGSWISFNVSKISPTTDGPKSGVTRPRLHAPQPHDEPDYVANADQGKQSNCKDMPPPRLMSLSPEIIGEATLSHLNWRKGATGLSRNLEMPSKKNKNPFGQTFLGTAQPYVYKQRVVLIGERITPFPEEGGWTEGLVFASFDGPTQWINAKSLIQIEPLSRMVSECKGGERPASSYSHNLHPFRGHHRVGVQKWEAPGTHGTTKYEAPQLRSHIFTNGYWSTLAYQSNTEQPHHYQQLFDASLPYVLSVASSTVPALNISYFHVPNPYLTHNHSHRRNGFLPNVPSGSHRRGKAKGMENTSPPFTAPIQETSETNCLLKNRTSSYSSQNTSHSSASISSTASSKYPGGASSPIPRRNMNVYTHCGRHTNEFLFGGRSFTDMARSLFRGIKRDD